MMAEHQYALKLAWTDKTGTECFSGFDRDHEIICEHKGAPLLASAPEWLRGDKSRYSAGDLFLAAIASSHMLRFLEVASQVGLVVVEYDDDVLGVAHLGSRGDGQISEVTLHPRLTVRPGAYANSTEVARLHLRAQSMSIISKSILVSIGVKPGPLTVLDETS